MSSVCSPQKNQSVERLKCVLGLRWLEQRVSNLLIISNQLEYVIKETVKFQSISIKHLGQAWYRGWYCLQLVKIWLPFLILAMRSSPAGSKTCRQTQEREKARLHSQLLIVLANLLERAGSAHRSGTKCPGIAVVVHYSAPLVRVCAVDDVMELSFSLYLDFLQGTF